MTEELQEKSIREAVMEKIKIDRETMRPKWHFVLVSALFIAALSAGIVILLFVVSFIFFTMDSGGSWFLPAFGSRGLRTFFSSLPWLLILSGIVLVILIEVLARRFSFVYRRPLLYFLLTILLLTAASSLAISRTPLHENFNGLAAEKKLPLVGPLYRNFDPRKNKDVHIGVINEIHGDGFLLDDRRGGMLLILVTPETVFPSGIDFATGDMVIVLGAQDDHTIRALGISAINFPPARIPVPKRK